MIDFSIPLTGMNSAESSVNRTAAQIAQSGFSGGDSVSLSSEAVAMIEARDSFAANARVVRTEDRMTGALLNMTS